jgi:hypothetical protein
MAVQDKGVDLSQEVMESILELRKRKETLNKELANIGEMKIVLENREEQAKKYYNLTIDYEKTIATEIETKYGQGQVDIELGKFYPAS